MMNALIVVLSVQGATAALVGVASLFGTEGFAHTVVDGRRLGAGFLAFAVMQAVVVIPKIRGSFWLIAIPLAWTVFHLTDSLFELFVLGDSSFVAPAAVESSFLAAYAVLAVLLSRRATSA